MTRADLAAYFSALDQLASKPGPNIFGAGPDLLAGDYGLSRNDVSFVFNGWRRTFDGVSDCCSRAALVLVSTPVHA